MFKTVFLVARKFIHYNEGVPSKLQAFLLGAPELHWRKEPCTIASKKGAALLYYLALTPKPVSRGELAELLWGVGRFQNLRQMLSTVRQLPGAKVWLNDGDPLSLACDCDAIAFANAVRTDNYKESLALYKGPLLGDFRLEATAFQDWFLLERARLQSLYISSLFAGATQLEEQGKPSEALALLRQLLTEDPLHEDAHRRVMVLEWKQNNIKAALEQFESCRRSLAEELGLEPVSSTRALFEKIREASAAVYSAPFDPGPHFIGRQDELAELESALAEGRLVSLLGPGGMGKTRLAKEFVRQSKARGTQEVYFISLSALRSARFIPAAIANTLQIAFKGPQDPLTQLSQKLEDEDVLLVLDNLEQLLGAPELIKNLLEATTKLRLLVTSRRALGLEAEHKLSLRGLSLPEDDADRAGGASDAVRLFVKASHRINPSFSLSIDNRGAIFRICRSLQGLPLGLELAAGWLRFYEPESLAETLASDALQLENPGLDLEERHSSLRQVMERSWLYLDGAETSALADLAVCRGGFSAQAAHAVAHADARILSSLIDHSLLRFTPKGRYQRHPLVYAFSHEKLQVSGRAEAASERHARYYLNELKRHRKAILGQTPGPALDDIELEFENIREAWNFAAGAGWETELLDAAETLSLYADMRARFHDALELFSRAVESLESRPETKLTRALLLIDKGTHLYRLSRYKEVLALTDGAAASIAPSNEAALDDVRRLRARCYYGLADYKNSRGLFEASLDHARKHRPEQLSRDLRSVANLEVCLGRYDAAEKRYREAIALDKQNGYQIGLAINLNNLSELLIMNGRLDEAEPMIEESFVYAEGVDVHLVPYLNLNEATLAFCRGEFAHAEDLAQRCHHEAKTYGQINLQSRSAALLARVSLQQQSLREAHKYMQHTIKLAADANEVASLMLGFVVYAELAIAQNMPKSAARYLAHVLKEPATEYSDKVKAKGLLETLDKTVQAEAAKQKRTLQDLIQDALPEEAYITQ